MECETSESLSKEQRCSARKEAQEVERLKTLPKKSSSS